MSESTDTLSIADIQATFDGSPFIATLGLEVRSLDHD